MFRWLRCWDMEGRRDFLGISWGPSLASPTFWFGWDLGAWDPRGSWGSRAAGREGLLLPFVERPNSEPQGTPAGLKTEASEQRTRLSDHGTQPPSCPAAHSKSLLPPHQDEGWRLRFSLGWESAPCGRGPPNSPAPPPRSGFWRLLSSSAPHGPPGLLSLRQRPSLHPPLQGQLRGCTSRMPSPVSSRGGTRLPPLGSPSSRDPAGDPCPRRSGLGPVLPHL